MAQSSFSTVPDVDVACGVSGYIHDKYDVSGAVRGGKEERGQQIKGPLSGSCTFKIHLTDFKSDHTKDHIFLLEWQTNTIAMMNA